MPTLRTVCWTLTIAFAAACKTPPAAPAALRLTGRGIVAGLNHTGTANSDGRKALLEHLRASGLQLQLEDIVEGSAAMAGVTCEIPPDAAAGACCDVRCETEEDGVSLLGGILLRTELRDDTGRVHAIAQGSLAVASPAAAPDGETRQPAVNVRAGLVPGGGIVVR